MKQGLAWSQSLIAIHRALPKGLSLWLDFSATPKDQNGMYFPWTVCDYPLAQAVEDRIVKAPIIVTKEDDPKQPKPDPDVITRENVCDKFGYWIHAAVKRWKEHYDTYKKLGRKNTRAEMSSVPVSGTASRSPRDALMNTSTVRLSRPETGMRGRSPMA